MDGKSSKADFNKSVKNESPKPERNYSDSKARSKLNAYEQLSSRGEKDAKMINGLKTKYETIMNKSHVNTFVRGKNFDLGVRAGLHANSNKKEALKGVKSEVQKARNEILKRAKENYKTNYSMSKSFAAKSQVKDKGLDMGK